MVSEERSILGLHLQTQWRRALHQYVEIRLNGQILRTGFVDAVMPDESILWISADGIHPREMIERASGKSIYCRYAWDTQFPSQLLPTESAGGKIVSRAD